MTALPEPRPLSGLALNPGARIEVLTIGDGRQPVLIVDEALVDARAMAEYAAETAIFAAPPADSSYPGRMARLPVNYLPAILSAFARPLHGVFGYAAGPETTAFGFFGLASVPQSALTPEQSVPHVDAVRPHAFASVHFLGGPEFGGTAFYRHKATGIEVVTPDNAEAGFRKRNAELDALKGQSQAELLALYEEIAYIEPVFNRLILYRANQLHSAKLAPVDSLPDDPRTGRLTANLFVNVR